MKQMKKIFFVVILMFITLNIMIDILKSSVIYYDGIVTGIAIGALIGFIASEDKDAKNL